MSHSSHVNAGSFSRSDLLRTTSTNLTTLSSFSPRAGNLPPSFPRFVLVAADGVTGAESSIRLRHAELEYSSILSRVRVTAPRVPAPHLRRAPQL